MYRGSFNSPADDASSTEDFSPHLTGALEPTAAIPTRRRIACILVSDFPLAALVRVTPELREQPLALVRMPAARIDKKAGGARAQYQPHSELTHVAPIAQAAGVRAGMTVAQARAILPPLRVIAPAAAAEQAAQEALSDAAKSLSPLIEEGESGCVWLDLTGLKRVYESNFSTLPRGRGELMQTSSASAAPRLPQPSLILGRASRTRPHPGGKALEEDGEQGVADIIAVRVRQLGLEAAVGIAATKELAYLAARCGGRRVIPAGREREFLDWMPLELADLRPRRDELELKLKRLGLRRLGDLARIDINAFGGRLGAAGVALARLARGEGSSTLATRRRGETFDETLELEYGVDNLEPLSFILRGMMQRLCTRLELRGLAAGVIKLALGLSDRSRDERRIAVAAATSEAAPLLVLLRLQLESAPPIAAIEKISLTLEPAAVRSIQHDMFLPPAPAPEKLNTALARIAAMCGPERAGILRAEESHRPEAVRVAKFASASLGPSSGAALAKNVARMALRGIRPAAEIEVMCARGRPDFVRGKTICARVVSCAGPWRYQGEWWGETTADDGIGAADSSSNQARGPAAYARDYYELALTDGAVYRVYRNLTSKSWYVDGVYD